MCFMKGKSMKLRNSILVLLLLISVGSSFAASGKFPYRSKYAHVPTIETKELFEALVADEVVIVDVRSPLEFEVIHVDVAAYIAVSGDGFEEKLGELVAKNPDKKFAFYCNGTTCLKAYKAAERALAAGYSNSYAYDAGIPDWAIIHPERTTLLGEKVIDPEKQLIKKSKFDSKCMAWNSFKAIGKMPQAIVVDVRDEYQKAGKLPGLEGALDIPLAQFITEIVSNQKYQDKTLLIFDQVGKQVRWLQYYLKANGYTEFIFLKGGATGVLKEQGYSS